MQVNQIDRLTGMKLRQLLTHSQWPARPSRYGQEPCRRFTVCVNSRLPAAILVQAGDLCLGINLTYPAEQRRQRP